MKPYWQSADGAIVLMLGDCREVLPTLGHVDHVLTDPPYEAEAHTLQRRVQHERGAGWAGRAVRVETLPFEPISAEERSVISREIARLVQRWALVFCQVEAAPLWRAECEASGLSYKRTCIWVKPDGMPQYSGDRPGMGYETLLAMHAPGRSRWNGGGQVGVFTFNKNGGGGKAHEHPTQKPAPLMRELIRLFTDPGDLILDPFAGSGTTLLAALHLGRRAIGIEIDERYAETAARRLENDAPLLRWAQPEQGALL